MKFLAFLLFLTAFLTPNYWQAFGEICLGIIAYVVGSVFGDDD